MQQNKTECLSLIDIKLQEALEEKKEAVNKINIARPFFSPDFISYDKFIDFLCVEGSIFLHRKEKKDFEIQEHHLFVIKNLYKHLTGDPTFEIKEGVKGDLFKGIVLAGNIGCGKSTLMYAYLKFFERLTHFVVKHLEAESMAEAIKANSIDFYCAGFLYINDICRESLVVKEYGNTLKPFINLIGKRYLSSWLTFGTTNYNPEYINKLYGLYTADRFFQMCNYMVLPGNSLRPIQSNIQLKFDI